MRGERAGVHTEVLRDVAHVEARVRLRVAQAQLPPAHLNLRELHVRLLRAASQSQSLCIYSLMSLCTSTLYIIYE